MKPKNFCAVRIAAAGKQSTFQTEQLAQMSPQYHLLQELSLRIVSLSNAVLAVQAINKKINNLLCIG